MVQDNIKCKECGNYLPGIFKINSKIQVSINFKLPLNYNTL